MKPLGANTLRAAWRVCVGALALALAACSRDARRSPTDVVVQFYTMRDAIGLQGAPSSDELRALRPFIADTLWRGLAHADSMRRSAMIATDTLSLFVRGDLFSSLFEGPSVFVIMPAIPNGTAFMVPVEFSSDRVRPAVRWADTVAVIQQNGMYVVQDVRYGAVRGAERAPSLLQQLSQR